MHVIWEDPLVDDSKNDEGIKDHNSQHHIGSIEILAFYIYMCSFLILVRGTPGIKATNHRDRRSSMNSNKMIR